MSNDKREKYFMDKSIHIKCTLAQHAEFKKVLADYGLGMREVLLECIERMCDPNEEYMKELLNECVENRILPRNRVSLQGDVENIYKLIEQSEPSGNQNGTGKEENK